MLLACDGMLLNVAEQWHNPPWNDVKDQVGCVILSLGSSS